MEEQYSKLEITPKLIDFGSRVVQMKLLATAGIGTVYPWRFLTWPLMAFGTLLAVGGYLSLQTTGMIVPRNPNFVGDHLALWIGLGFLVSGAAAYFTSKRLLVLSLAGGEKIVLTEAREMFLETIVARIREAMIAPADAGIHHTVNINAETIETRSIVDASTTVDNRSTSVTNSPGANLNSPGAVGIGRDNTGPVSAQANGTVTASQESRPKPNGRARSGSNGQGSPYGHDTAGALAAIVESGRAAKPAPLVQAAQGGIAMSGDFRGATISSSTNVDADLTAMIALVERAQVQDHARIVEYLRVLQQLTAAGPSRSAEARNTWLTFFDYAGKALTGIDGFMVVAERVHRWYRSN